MRSLFTKPEPASFRAITQVDAYWEALRRGRAMPDRSEVDPRGLGEALEYAFLMEQIAPGIGRIRVAGTHIRDLLGMEARGMPLTAMFLPGAREQVADALSAVSSTGQVADLTLKSPAGIGRPVLHARLFMAPLFHNGVQSARILGALESQGETGRTPRRFEVTQVQMRRIVATAAAQDTRPESAHGAKPESAGGAKPESAGGAKPRPVFVRKSRLLPPAPRVDISPTLMRNYTPSSKARVDTPSSPACAETPSRDTATGALAKAPYLRLVKTD
ncbi:MAG: PAS domain-containing protein [Pseudomonadota bacterium]